MHTEASAPALPYDTYILEAPSVAAPPGQSELSFWLSMNGNAMGTLHVEQLDAIPSRLPGRGVRRTAYDLPKTLRRTAVSTVVSSERDRASTVPRIAVPRSVDSSRIALPGAFNMGTLLDILQLLLVLYVLICAWNLIMHLRSPAHHHERWLERQEAMKRTHAILIGDQSHETLEGIWPVHDAERYLIEIDEEGNVTREIALASDGSAIHRHSCFEERPTFAWRGFTSIKSVFADVELPEALEAESMSSGEFERAWKDAEDAGCPTRTVATHFGVRLPGKQEPAR